MSKKYREEFVNEVERQLTHESLKRDYLAHKIETKDYGDTGQERAKAKLQLDAMDKKIDDLKEMYDWFTA
jgi:hypothetical protein